MSKMDTSAEAVEQMASYLDHDAPHQNHIEAIASAMLRALLKERDAARAEAERLREALSDVLPLAEVGHDEAMAAAGHTGSPWPDEIIAARAALAQGE